MPFISNDIIYKWIDDEEYCKNIRFSKDYVLVRKLYVHSKEPYKEEHLYHAFKKYGTIELIEVLENGKEGFITFASDRDACLAFGMEKGKGVEIAYTWKQPNAVKPPKQSDDNKKLDELPTSSIHRLKNNCSLSLSKNWPLTTLTEACYGFPKIDDHLKVLKPQHDIFRITPDDVRRIFGLIEPHKTIVFPASIKTIIPKINEHVLLCAISISSAQPKTVQLLSLNGSDNSLVSNSLNNVNDKNDDTLEHLYAADSTNGSIVKIFDENLPAPKTYDCLHKSTMLNDVPEKIQIITRTRNPFKELLHKSHTIGDGKFEETYITELVEKFEPMEETTITRPSLNESGNYSTSDDTEVIVDSDVDENGQTDNRAVSIDLLSNKTDSDDSDFTLTYEELFGNESKMPQSYEYEYATAAEVADPPVCETNDLTISFFVWNHSLVAYTEHNVVQYDIGHLDLNDEERLVLDEAIKTTVVDSRYPSITVDRNDVVIENSLLSIKRIPTDVRVIEDSSNNLISKFNTKEIPSFDSSKNLISRLFNTKRIQFSDSDPLLAKYEDTVYFVGAELYKEYMELLKSTEKPIGTAIQMNVDRIKINRQNQLLDIYSAQSYHCAGVFVFSASSEDKEMMEILHDFSVYSKHRRWMITPIPIHIVEVKAQLMYSSQSHTRTEIYAVLDSVLFPTTVNDLKTTVSTLTNDMQKSCKNAQSKEQKPSKADKKEKTRKADVYDSQRDDDEELIYYPNQNNMKKYEVPSDIQMIARSWSPPEELLLRYNLHRYNDGPVRTNQCEYTSAFRTMIYLEEEAEKMFVEKFNMSDLQLSFHMDDLFYFKINMQHIRSLELMAAIKEKHLDWFILIPKFAKQMHHAWGEVVRTDEPTIYIRIFEYSLKKVLQMYKYENYDLQFQVNRTTYLYQHVALDQIAAKNLFATLINNPKYTFTPTDEIAEKFCQMSDKAITSKNLNEEQRSAVQNILNGNNYPLPYILYGPPGTGKTSTLVAAIEQIVLTTNNNILVCAMSNAASDEIAERLLDILDNENIYRFNAISRGVFTLRPRLRAISNCRNDRFFIPSKNELMKHRVIVCTLSIAGILGASFKKRHFQYVFIDECASAHETMALIPVAGVCAEKNNVSATIVLAGDPKQLDAVTKSKWAKKLGYETSWLEQLCTQNLYKRNSETGRFNEIYITQLVKNYRSHPAILEIPNELFYENKLEACASTEKTHWYINSNILPSSNFPVIFKSVRGICNKEFDFSLFNQDEVDAVYEFIKMLLPPKSAENSLRRIEQSDIGVVTPYRLQCRKIRKKCYDFNYKNVTVGTAEVFQGQEKPVMIVSTVRSGGDILGFVSNERRLNVMITRAKSLLIIIGDPHTLGNDENWLRLMEYCMENNSFI